MDTQGGKNWGYPGNAKRKRKKKKTWEGQIKRQNQTNRRPEQPENKAANKQDPIQQPAWVSNTAGAMPRGLSSPCLGNAQSDGDATQEKRRGRTLSFSPLGCKPP